MKFTLDGAQTIVSLNLEEARETAKYDHRTSEYWPTLIGERLWFLNMLNNIEAESVKHGKWINDQGLYKCSICNNFTITGWNIPIEQMNKTMKYCNNCGAKMDGGESE